MRQWLSIQEHFRRGNAIGDVNHAGEFKLDSGCTLSATLFAFLNAHARFVGVRIDENNPTVASLRCDRQPDGDDNQPSRPGLREIVDHQ